LLLPAGLAAQASAYVPLDHPLLPAFEHLITRGEVEDPSPSVRPFRRVDAVQALDRATERGTVRDTALATVLREAFSDPPDRKRWQIGVAGGGQAYSHARRDPLHPAGPEGARPYLEFLGEATFGNIVAVSRPAIEPRLSKDPDWPGRHDLQVVGRHVEGYLSAQFRWVRLFFGLMDQNWGPVGLPGIGLSPYAYPRTSLGLELGDDRIRLAAQASELRDAVDTTGAVVHRYFFAHRLSARISHRLDLALWETTVLAGVDRRFDWRYANPVTLIVLADQYGLGDNGNVLVGLDAQWRITGRTTLGLQLGIDDIQYKNRSGPTRTPDRFAFTAGAWGPLGHQLSWRGLYTVATSLAFRTTNPFEGFTDSGVGLGRNYADNEQFTLLVTAPVTPRWLVTPELTLLRQGAGRIGDPFPPAGTARGDTPWLFIGAVENTWRSALGISGRQGRLAVSANGGLHYMTNADNVPGRHRTRFEGRIQATLGIGWSGSLQ
jgi:hypothetical protein